MMEWGRKPAPSLDLRQVEGTTILLPCPHDRQRTHFHSASSTSEGDSEEEPCAGNAAAHL